MTCSECWTSVPKGVTKCPRCGAKVTGAAPSVLGLFRNYPWLAVLLALSVMVTGWAATRRPPQAPPVEEIPPAVEPVAEPAPEPEAAMPMPALPASEPEPAPEPAPAAPAAARSTEEPPPPPPSSAAHENPNGTWGTGPSNRTP